MTKSPEDFRTKYDEAARLRDELFEENERLRVHAARFRRELETMKHSIEDEMQKRPADHQRLSGVYDALFWMGLVFERKVAP